MELPRALRDAVDRELAGVALSDLRRAAQHLSERYRNEVRDGRAHLADDLAVRAYLSVRMPATYAAIRASLDATAELRPDFAPVSMLDAGAGPGTGVFAARDRWPGLADATLIEGSSAIRSFGERLMAAAAIQRVRWVAQDLATLPETGKAHDLVLLAYVLGELQPATVPSLIQQLWKATCDMLVVVEPGTPAGWTRILAVRALLLESGAQLVAPCPHARKCPLKEPDWCHFSRRVARSRLHRQTKSAEVPWEDEKFIYIAASRHPGLSAQARVIAPPAGRGGTVSLKLCQADGSAARRLFSRRDGPVFRQARRLGWGDPIMPDADIPGMPEPAAPKKPEDG